jgi:putative phosphoesterase
MKIAIISDIHSNLEALETAVKHINSKEKVDDIICLGDIVGYGANPEECIDTVFNITDKVCMGNHDYAVLYPEIEDLMNTRARLAVRWTREKVFDLLKSKEKDLKKQIESESILYVHSNPLDPFSWDYIFGIEAQIYLESMHHNLCFIGHTHQPDVFSESENIIMDNEIIKLDKDHRTIVNVGSIGQPRDSDKRLCYAVFDDAEWSLKFIRLEYDVNLAREKIIKAGLPKELGDRLLKGY